MSDTNDNPAPSRPRRKRKSYALLILAAGMLAFGVAAGTLYYVLRPTTLRIAVGPAGSDDQKLIQLMAQTFAREGSPVRLSPITTEGAQQSIALFNAGKTDLAVARGDLNLPAECRVRRHPAQECRRAVVGARASDEGQETVGAQGQDAGCPARASRRRDRTDGGQRQAAARHPEGVRHRSGKGHGQPVRHQPDSPRWRAIRRSTRSWRSARSRARSR